MDNETRRSNKEELKPSYWLDACEDDLVIPAGDFVSLGGSVEGGGSSSDVGLDPGLFDSIPTVANVVDAQKVTMSKVGKDDSCNGSGKRRGGGSDRDKGYDTQVGKRPRIEGGRDYRERSSRKRLRDYDRRDRGSVRKKEPHFNSGGTRGSMDVDWREGRGYWERDRLGTNDMVFHPGSWAGACKTDVKASVEKHVDEELKKDDESNKKVPQEHARKYQLDVLEQAKNKNTIAFLETGAGKTLIAVLLIKSVSLDLHRQGKKMLAVFLVPKVPLVYQQAEVIREQTGYQVGHYCGEMGQDFWDARRWQREFEKKQVAFHYKLKSLKLPGYDYETVFAMGFRVKLHHPS